MLKAFILIIITLLSLHADVGVLKKVVDGDTLHFTNDKCRILYIDTPESYRNKKAKRDTKQCKNFTLDTMVKMGKQSTDHAKELVTVGKHYKYDVIGHDYYKRALCIVYTPKGIFNELMVKDGYAVTFDKYLPKTVRRRYHLLEQEAKKNNRGLWKNPNIDCLGN
jgi:micrococcal nuclease